MAAGDSRKITLGFVIGCVALVLAAIDGRLMILALPAGILTHIAGFRIYRETPGGALRLGGAMLTVIGLFWIFAGGLAAARLL